MSRRRWIEAGTGCYPVHEPEIVGLLERQLYQMENVCNAFDYKDVLMRNIIKPFGATED
jgi:hypothetical protein